MRFPNLFEKWTHWKITGDGHLISVVDGGDLQKALKVVEDSYGKYASIKAIRATVDQDGNLLEEKKAKYEISNYSNDEKIRERRQRDSRLTRR